MGAGDAIYRLLLRAFPARIRRPREEEMVRLFALQRAAAAGRPVALAMLWLRAVADALWHGLAARRGGAEVTAGRDRQRPRGRGWAARSAAAAAGVLRDARFAVRGLRRTPGLSIVAVIALALGIGANAAIFSAIYAVLIAPLPYPHADEVVLLWRRHPSMGSLSLSPEPDAVARWRTSRSLASIVVYAGGQFTVASGSGEPASVEGIRIEPSLLAFAGARPVLGRPFTEADAASPEPRVALLSDELWTSRFGRDPEVVGRTIDLDDRRVEIIGVLPDTFRVPLGKHDIVVPLTPPPRGRDGRVLPYGISAMARVARGISDSAAEAELSALMAAGDKSGWTARLMKPAELALPLRRALIVLMAAVGCVLLIASANVVHLLLARNASRRRELSVRAALGASRGRLLTQLLTENVVLAFAGGLAGVGVARLAIDLIVAWRPADLRQLAFVRLGPETGLFVFVVSLATGFIIGVVPAWTASRRAAWDDRADGSRSVGDRRGRWVRRGLSVAEVALALVLVTGAGLLLKSYGLIVNSDRGYSGEGLVEATINLPPSRYLSAASVKDFHDRFAASVLGLPGVKRMVLASTLPPQGGLHFGELEIEGGRPTGAPTRFDGGEVQPGFFEALRIPLLEGRGFLPADVERDAEVVVVGAQTARQFWPAGSAVGRRLRLGPDSKWLTVIGVAGDVKTTASQFGAIQIYTLLADPGRDFSVAVQTSSSPDDLVAAVRAQIHAIDSKLPVRKITTMRQAVWEANVRPRFNALLLGLMAGVGLTLAISGVYGVINYSVGLRTRELGLRVALGAAPDALGNSVLREAAVLGVTGVAIGLALWSVLGRLIASLLFGLAPGDTMTLAAAAVVLAAATVIAAWIPSRKAVRIDPVVALRDA